MLDHFHLFNMRLKWEARIHELRETLRWELPFHRRKCAAKLKGDFEKAVEDRDEEAVAAAHTALIQIEVQPRLFRKAGKK